MSDDGKGHTPGPWERCGYIIVGTLGPTVVAKVPNPRCDEEVEEARADADLIAAAQARAHLPCTRDTSSVRCDPQGEGPVPR